MTQLSRPRPSPFIRLFTRLSLALDGSIGWDKLPLLIGLAALIGYRMVLRQRNLYDTGGITSAPRPTPPPGGRQLVARTADGTFNDLDYPVMGSAGTRFGRNVPLERTYPEGEPAILTPNPRTVSRELLTRDTFKPATTLNLLAAAWLQFMVHDWMSHGKNEKENPWRIPLADDDDFPQRPMLIMRTRRDPSAPPGSGGSPPTYANTESHWWDGSQLYGSDQATQDKVRSRVDGKLTIGPDGLLPVDPESGIDITGVGGNWWVGLSLFHAIFTLEHNAICDRLRAENPSWSDDDLFDKARLINAALLAKIHTTEWTPAIVAHPTTVFALRANWWGLEMERLSNLVGRLTDVDLIRGIPGSPTDHHGAPYCLTEEFVAVYRMHPLLPDDLSFRSVADDRLLQQRTFPEVAFRNARAILQQVSVTDAIYSFGTMHPGAITLHNYPRSLQRLQEPDGTINDLAAIDIMRIRERGVPRYNEFRELLHLRPAGSFEELTGGNRVWAEQLRRVYGGDINRVDLMVGLYAEPVPKGFGFSDTAFRIFILMASRRLKSDRFFTVDFTPAVYTRTGLEWIRDNTLLTVLRRHYPALTPTLRQMENAFKPWPRAVSA
jgi:hypothetical protein